MYIVLVFVCLLGGVLCEEQSCGGIYTTQNIETTPGVFVTKQRYISLYTCPLKDVPSATLCCDKPKYNCCRESSWWEIDFWLGIMIATVVVVVCALLAILFIVCCCYERCPFYMACRKEAKMDYIADSLDPCSALSPMPNDNEAHVKVYVPANAPHYL